MPESDEIKSALSIRDDITKLKNQINNIDSEYKKKKDLILKEIEKLQKCCSHPHQEFFPDPAGGSGSYDVCLYCGKEI